MGVWFAEEPFIEVSVISEAFLNGGLFLGGRANLQFGISSVVIMLKISTRVRSSAAGRAPIIVTIQQSKLLII